MGKPSRLLWLELPHPTSTLGEKFRHARTTVIRKPGKPEHDTLGAWRRMVLLSTIGKLIETNIAQRTLDLVEEHGFVPATQMEARHGRSNSSANLLYSNMACHYVCDPILNTLTSPPVARCLPYYPAIQSQSLRTIVRLHANHRKAESSGLIQFRTGRTGLVEFPSLVVYPTIPM